MYKLEHLHPDGRPINDFTLENLDELLDVTHALYAACRVTKNNTIVFEGSPHKLRGEIGLCKQFNYDLKPMADFLPTPGKR